MTKDGRDVVTLNTEQRFYPVREMVTTEAGFRMSPGVTLLVSIGENDPEMGYAVRAVYHPFVIWIWIGALMMALAGFISLTDSRLRRARSDRVSDNVSGNVTVRPKAQSSTQVEV